MEKREMMKPVIYNIDNKPVGDKCVGNKAYNLYKINGHVSVPEFITLDSSEMIKILSLEQNHNTDNELRTLWLNKLSLSNYLDFIQKKICDMYIPDLWLDEIKSQLKRYDVKPPYSVRTSSIYEDTDNSSAPGVFNTLLNVGEDGLADAIKKCWASNFTMKSMYYFGNKFKCFDEIKMGVIIQTMTEGEYAGILFTSNPVSGKREIVVEMTEKISDKLTDGEEVGRKIFIEPLTGKMKPDGETDKVLADSLLSQSEKLRKLYKKELDIEWVSRNSKLYIIQVRPITTVVSGEGEKDCQICSISKLESIFSKNASLENRIRNWRGKKQHFYSACDKLKIKHLEWYFVRNFSSEIQRDIENILYKFRGDFVTMALNDTLTDVVVRKEEVIGMLREYSSMDSVNSIVSLREVPINHISIISNVVDEDMVYIEVIDGIMKGLKTGELKSSKYKVDALGNMVYKEEHHNEKCYNISFPDGKIYMTDNEITSYKDIEALFVTAAENTRRLFLEGQIGAVEWWICDGELYATDISLNRSKITVLGGKEENYYISKGKIDGVAYFLEEEDIKELNRISYGNAISVDYFDESITCQESYKRLREKIAKAGENKRVILCMKRPVLGVAPILDIIDGVVFENASLLCHLSVMLREKEIPAVAVDKQYKNIKAGKYIIFQ